MNSTFKTQKMKKQSNSYDQDKIKIVCDNLCEKIETLLDHLGLEYRINPRFISMSCPIHGGDNISALNLYHTGETYRGNWKCRTHKCDEVFKSSIIGFVRGILSNRKYNWAKNGDTTCSFKEALDYCTEFLNLSFDNISISKLEKDKNTFIQNINLLKNNNEESENNKSINRNIIRNHLSIPSKYFLSRGFSKEILDKYDVGDCITDGKEMYGRAVVPVYDTNHKYMVGCSGRSYFDQCITCKCYHESQNCPAKEQMGKHSKWRHSSGFKTQQHLYNFWYAKDHIIKTGSVIIVESPGNVWRLEENNIHNSVALFGANLTDRQKTILDSSGAMNIITIMDNDDAGRKAAELIRTKCSRTYNIKHIIINKNDVADMSSNEIKKEIIPFI